MSLFDSEGRKCILKCNFYIQNCPAYLPGLYKYLLPLNNEWCRKIIGESTQYLLSYTVDTRGPFLESPENLSGLKFPTACFGKLIF